MASSWLISVKQYRIPSSFTSSGNTITISTKGLPFEVVNIELVVNNVLISKTLLEIENNREENSIKISFNTLIIDIEKDYLIKLLPSDCRTEYLMSELIKGDKLKGRYIYSYNHLVCGVHETAEELEKYINNKPLFCTVNIILATFLISLITFLSCIYNSRSCRSG